MRAVKPCCRIETKCETHTHVHVTYIHSFNHHPIPHTSPFLSSTGALRAKSRVIILSNPYFAATPKGRIFVSGYAQNGSRVRELMVVILKETFDTRFYLLVINVRPTIQRLNYCITIIFNHSINELLILCLPAHVSRYDRRFGPITSAPPPEGEGRRRRCCWLLLWW